jgi:hypothetical protein
MSRPRWCAKRTQGCTLVWTGIALRLVGSTTARVALYRSARSRGYKLSRERGDPRSLLRGDVCVVVLGRCVFLISVLVL